ncbi:MAG: hypothetical protein ACXACX_02575 [Candidatus Hodarchaeales archaeon]|jgi:hypothetical protein
MTTESLSPVLPHFLPKTREYIDHIPEDRVFSFKYKLLKGKARRQFNSYLRRIRFQISMKRVYVYEINKLILNEVLTAISSVINFKF